MEVILMGEVRVKGMEIWERMEGLMEDRVRNMERGEEGKGVEEGVGVEDVGGVGIVG